MYCVSEMKLNVGVQCPPNSSDRRTGRTNMWSVRFASFPAGLKCPMLLPQGSKLTLARWPVASGFAVGPVKSAIHWPGWPVKFWNPTSEITWFSANLSYRMNQCQQFKIEYINIRVHESNIERDFVLTIYKRASESLVGPVEFRLHWFGGPVGWKC